MPNYVIVYIGGKQPKSPKDGEKQYKRYREWLLSLGDSVISPANPFKNSFTISSDGSISKGSSTLMSGYTTISANTIEEALERAKSCPFLDIDGTLEVSELVEMSQEDHKD